MIPLKDLTFLIALRVDSDDRLKNLDITVNYIQHHFDTNIVICEQDTTSHIENRYNNVEHVFSHNSEFFNRQKGVNLAASHAHTPVIVHYDADILLTPSQIQKAVDVILDKQAQIIYPYDGHFYDVPKTLHEQIITTKSVSGINVNECILFNPHSVGGAVFFDTKVFWEGGGANENFKGLGYEDNEINTRFTKLGYNIGRVSKPLFHLNHVRLESSFNYNPHLEENKREFFRIDNMSKEQLREEIKTWNWIHDHL